MNIDASDKLNVFFKISTTVIDFVESLFDDWPAIEPALTVTVICFIGLIRFVNQPIYDVPMRISTARLLTLQNSLVLANIVDGQIIIS